MKKIYKAVEIIEKIEFNFRLYKNNSYTESEPIEYYELKNQATNNQKLKLSENVLENTSAPKKNIGHEDEFPALAKVYKNQLYN